MTISLALSAGGALAHPAPPQEKPVSDVVVHSPSTGVAAKDSASKGDLDRAVVVDRKSGLFGDVIVVDIGHHRALRFGSSFADDQTMIDLDNKRAIPVEYVAYTGAALSFAKSPKRALIVGFGGGAFARVLSHLEPGLQIDAVEIDPVVVEFARKYFDVDTISDLKITVEDGATFIAGKGPTWNLIALDAYGSDDMPVALVSSSFFTNVHKRLSPEGAVVLNLAVNEDNERKILARFRRVFSTCLTLRTPEDGNLVVIGTDRTISIRHARAADVARRQRARLPILPLRFRDCEHPQAQ